MADNPNNIDGKATLITASDLHYMSNKLEKAAMNLRQNDKKSRAPKRVMALKKRVDGFMRGTSDKDIGCSDGGCVSDVKKEVSAAVDEQQRWDDESPQVVPVHKTPLPRLQQVHKNLVQAEDVLKRRK